MVAHPGAMWRWLGNPPSHPCGKRPADTSVKCRIPVHPWVSAWQAVITQKACEIILTPSESPGPLQCTSVKTLQLSAYCQLRIVGQDEDFAGMIAFVPRQLGRVTVLPG